MALMRSFCQKCGGLLRVKFQHKGNQLPVFIITCDEGCGEHYEVLSIRQVIEMLENNLCEQA